MLFAESVEPRLVSFASMLAFIASLARLAEHYATHPDDAAKLVAVGESKPRSADLPRLAAWTMLVNQLSNLDEVLCK